MKATLLLCAGLLTLLGTMPASATPVFDAAKVLSQATINPIYMDYGDIKGDVSTMQEAARLIADVEEPSDGLDKVGRGVLILSGLIDEAAEANTSTDAAGRKIIDCEGFTAMLARSLNNKHPELVKFAAVGWDMSEKRAKEKIARLLKSPTWVNTNSAIIAILVGMLTSTRTATEALDSRAGSGILKAQEDAKKGWIELESVSFT